MARFRLTYKSDWNGFKKGDTFIFEAPHESHINNSKLEEIRKAIYDQIGKRYNSSFSLSDWEVTKL